jgi:hypothetical protein
MTGFKDGAVGWDDDDDDSERATPVEDQSDTSDREPMNEDTEDTADPSAGLSQSRLPWIHGRNSITDGRQKTVQLHLQASTIDREREGISEVQQMLSENVKKADLREAALLVGLTHLNELSDQLREWGYDF